MNQLITAAPAWQQVDMVSDLHLQASTSHTAHTWHRYLAQTKCDALFILGDFFEVWVGDDILHTPLAPQVNTNHLDNIAFWQQCTHALRSASQRMVIYMVVGNRDFLLGTDFFEASGVQPLAELTTLDWHGSRYLLAHGDQWCTDDQNYQAFRQQVRSAQWQQAFLAQPLDNRLEQAMHMRRQSAQRMRTMAALPDVNEQAVAASANEAQVSAVIHGHTHTGLDHTMANGIARHVLSDWDCDARPERAQVLRLCNNIPQTVQRIAVNV